MYRLLYPDVEWQDIVGVKLYIEMMLLGWLVMLIQVWERIIINMCNLQQQVDLNKWMIKGNMRKLED